MAGALIDRPRPQNQDPTRGRANPTVCRATYGGRGGTQTAARPGSKAGPSHPRRRRAGPAAGVPGRRHPRRLLRVGLADTIRVAAELPAAFAHAPPGPLAVVQMLGFVGETVGLPGPEMPRPGRQVELTHPPPLGGADKTPSPPTARVADCGEGNFVVDVAPLAGPPIGDGAAHPHPTIRAVAGRYLEGDGESVVVVGGPNFILPSAWTSSRMAPARTRGRMSSENVVSTRARPPVRMGPYYQIVATVLTTANAALATAHWACTRAQAACRLRRGATSGWRRHRSRPRRGGHCVLRG